MKMMNKAEFEKKFPLTAPECPYCYKTTVRRRRFWSKHTSVQCKTPKCGGRGELTNFGHNGQWLWTKFSL